MIQGLGSFRFRHSAHQPSARYRSMVQWLAKLLRPASNVFSNGSQTKLSNDASGYPPCFFELLEPRHLLSGQASDMPPPPAMTVTGTVFEDHNGNGQHNTDDQGLEGRTVFADLDGNGVLDVGEPSTLTQADGSYALANLPIGTLDIRLLNTTGFVQTLPTFDPQDADLSGEQEVVIDDFIGVPNVDFASFQRASITGQVYLDNNFDGKRNNGDFDQSGVTVFLDMNQDGQQNINEPVTQTGTGGVYLFENVGPDVYPIVAIVPNGTAAFGPNLANSLTGAQNTMPLLTSGQGYVSAFYDAFQGELLIKVDFQSLQGAAQNITINMGQPFEDGPVLYDLASLFGLTPGFSVPFSGRIAIDPQHVTDLLSGNLYVNVLTDVFPDTPDMPGGAIRGQLLPSAGPVVEPLSGQMVTGLNIGHAPLTPVAFDSSQIKAVAIELENDQIVTVRLRKGVGTINLIGLGIAVNEPKGGVIRVLGNRLSIQSIDLSQSTYATSLTIRNSDPTTPVTLEDINVLGSIGRIVAPHINLSGDISITGGARSIRLYDVTGFASEIALTFWDGQRTLSLRLNDVDNLSVMSDVPIRRLIANNIAQPDQNTASIQAPWLGTLRVAQDFSSDLFLVSSSRRLSLRNANIGGLVDSSFISAASSMGNLKFGAIANSTVYSGVSTFSFNVLLGSLLDMPEDFKASESRIKSVIIKGIDDVAFAFDNTNIAAWRIDKIKLGLVLPNEIFTTQGIAAHAIKSYFRQREEFFSPRSRNLVGPLPQPFDTIGNFEGRLI